MSKMTFSSEQESAISALGENYLISAGAGSGKTAVLTERIYRIAKKNQTLDNFLVLTFTNLAAAEMKDRVRKKLLDDKETASLASEVDNAHIETFDSFSLYLVKKYFYELGISKDVSIVDNSVLSIKRKEYLDEIFEEKYLLEEEDFLKLIDEYATKNEDSLKDFIIKLLESSDKKANSFEFFDSLLTDYFDEKTIDKALNNYVKEVKGNLEFIKEKAYELEDVDDSTNIVEFANDLLLIDDYGELYRRLTNPETSKFPVKPKNKTDDVEYRKKIADFYNRKIRITGDNDYGEKEEVTKQYLKTKSFVLTLIQIAIKVEDKLDLFKKEHNAFSFGDISRYVLALLKNKKIKKEISDSFDYIMVDEYQDTNDIQETVISSISKNNVYMVGDVKQSIYRFRGADCHIFQEKYENYKLGRGGKEIDLNKSYRSRREVVNFINDLFSKLMIKKNNIIDYSNGHEFGFAREEYEQAPSKSNYIPEVYSYSYEKANEMVEKEIDIIIKDMLHKINDKYEVYDGKLKRCRPCEWKDFSIIIDRGSSFDSYRRKFSLANIPLKVEAKETLFRSDVILLVKSLTKLLYYSLINKYESEYKHAYFSVARSFLYEYSDDTLYQIHKNKSYLNEPFAQKIELIKEKLRYAPIKEVLLTLYEEFDIYMNISKITKYYANTHKLEHLLTLSESMDVLGYTLEDFIKYFDDLDEMDEDIDYSDSDAQENSVTLINIHKSKGLEYPIIYFPGLNKQFNRQDLMTSFLVSNNYGVIIPSSKEEKSSLFIHLIKEELNKEDFEEKIRLLYVALTRAKEKIILINGSKESEIRFVKATSSKTMSDIISLTDIFERYQSSYSLENVSISTSDSERQINKITLKEINVPAQEIISTRASKEIDEEVNQSVLDFGTELHAYLSMMDLENKSLDYVKNRQMKKYVYNVMNSSLFNGVKNSEVRHEFRFYDEVNNVQGFIDALIIKEDEIDIIDFKLKNIDEIEYDRQLRIYKKYISSITTKKIRMFLLAAITGEIREVKDE